MMNMTFPLSYIFFISVMEEEEILLVSIFRRVPMVRMLTRLKVSVCALSTILHHVRTRATGTHKR